MPDQDYDIQKAFELFYRTHDLKLREELLMRYIHLAKQVAGRMIISMPQQVNIDDLISAGLMGLVKGGFLIGY